MDKDLISIVNLKRSQIEDILSLTDSLIADRQKFSRHLTGKTLALIFQKPSNRTRVSFEVGMYQLGGNSIYLSPGEINLGVRESIKDVAKTLSRYVDGIVIRTFEHANVVELAKYSSVPVINGLSDFSHPCQALADIYTVTRKLKDRQKITLAYIGDGNNVSNSLLYVCAKLGINMKMATPKGYEPDGGVLEGAVILSKETNCLISHSYDPAETAEGADVIYTDVWTSMGQEKEAAKRKKAFEKFQINSKLVSLAKAGALIMHCLPAHRGEEITDEVIDGANSIVFDQAENRLHVQKAILIKLLGDNK
ncbi:MAG: ornithine carbamoyltransferase [Candidatus Omnitrophota bacterium]|nr:MAG: ornithine carbamoyltransferase [Candidatus Omnitrophota bacterium]